jgi:hypothetical protein
MIVGDNGTTGACATSVSTNLFANLKEARQIIEEWKNGGSTTTVQQVKYGANKPTHLHRLLIALSMELV